MRKNFKLSGLGGEEDLEGLGRGKEYDQIYFNLKLFEIVKI